MLLEGTSGTEEVVAENLKAIIGRAKGRIAVTTFASNVSRLIAIAEAARAANRELVLIGRAMHRIAEAARDTGLWPEHLTYLDQESFSSIPRERVVALITGSQGEAQAALARIAKGEHPYVKFDRGDAILFSSRTIPGNEDWRHPHPEPIWPSAALPSSPKRRTAPSTPPAIHAGASLRASTG